LKQNGISIGTEEKTLENFLSEKRLVFLSQFCAMLFPMNAHGVCHTIEWQSSQATTSNVVLEAFLSH
jgi:hypothetical protein